MVIQVSVVNRVISLKTAADLAFTLRKQSRPSVSTCLLVKKSRPAVSTFYGRKHQIVDCLYVLKIDNLYIVFVYVHLLKIIAIRVTAFVNLFFVLKSTFKYWEVLPLTSTDSLLGVKRSGRT